MKKLLLVLVLLSLTLAFQINAKAKAQMPTVSRVNPVCVASHLNGLSQSNVDKQTTLMQQAGVNWTRFDFNWAGIETSPNIYNWSQYDYIVNNATSKGIKVIAMIPQYNVPSWRNNNQAWNYPATNPSDYGNFVRDAAAHYGNKITLYELGNEPNIPIFWQPSPNVASYSALLKAGYIGIKSVNPNVKVISAGLGWMPQNDINFAETYLQSMYSQGVKGYFDYFAYHPYSWPNSPDDVTHYPYFSELTNLHQIMINNGDDKQIMATEVGWPSTTQSGGVNETTQANYINRVFQKIEYENFQFVPIACIYDFLDDGNSKTNAEFNFGVLNWKYQKKPSFQTLINVRSDYNLHFIPINP